MAEIVTVVHVHLDSTWHMYVYYLSYLRSTKVEIQGKLRTYIDILKVLAGQADDMDHEQANVAWCRLETDPAAEARNTFAVSHMPGLFVPAEDEVIVAQYVINTSQYC